MSIKCKKCGNIVTGKFCKYCGEPAPDFNPVNQTSYSDSKTLPNIPNIPDLPNAIENINKSNIWIKGLKIVCIIQFILISLASFIGGIGVMFSGRHLEFELFIGGLLVMAFGLIIAFMSVALLMVFLNMAQDIAEIKSKLNTK